MLLAVASLGTLLLAAAPQSTARSSDALAPMAYFIGDWVCSGVFPSTGKTISSKMSFRYDLDKKAIVKHHDDTSPPALYHAVELWVFSASDKRFNAAIVDNFGGVRDFTSPGWDGDTLVWSSQPSVQPPQQFVYKKTPSNGFSVDWRVSRDGKTYVVGDTLTCVNPG